MASQHHQTDASGDDEQVHHAVASEFVGAELDGRAGRFGAECLSFEALLGSKPLEENGERLVGEDGRV